MVRNFVEKMIAKMQARYIFGHMTNAMTTATATVTEQQAMSLMLKALGFDAMSAAVMTESDEERLARYARVILKNIKTPELKERAASTLRQFGRIL